MQLAAINGKDGTVFAILQFNPATTMHAAMEWVGSLKAQGYLIRPARPTDKGPRRTINLGE